MEDLSHCYVHVLLDWKVTICFLCTSLNHLTVKFLREARSGETECQYLSSRQYSALNKDFQDDVCRSRC